MRYAVLRVRVPRLYNQGVSRLYHTLEEGYLKETLRTAYKQDQKVIHE